MKFLRNLLASIMGTLIALGMAFMVFLIFVSVLGSAEETVVVKDNSILRIDIDQPLKDYGGKYYWVDFEYRYEDYNGLNNILNAIAFAKNDRKIKGISINNKFLMAGTAQIKAIRDALKDFKESGKFVYAYGDYYTQGQYYLASVADSVYLNPVGEIDFRGLSSEVLFFKGLQEKTGVKMEVIRHGKYKSAVEPFLNDEMSEANRKQITELLMSVWNTVLEDISESRNLSKEQLNEYADNLAARTPELAVQNHFIDKSIFLDEYEAALRYSAGLGRSGKINYIDLSEYAEYASKRTSKAGKDRIAVVYAQGEIMYGTGNQHVIGQGVIIDALRKAADDNKVKAIVLRVDSPGGSALASDIIWREVELTKRKKPVVVSMGNVAASGGYYIACGADRIFAEPNTITGSIGVFGTVPNITELAHKWGVNAEQVNTNKRSASYSIFEPMSDDFRSVTTESIENIYQTFLSRVAQGRDLEIAAVDSIAQGRVWSGVEAKQLGLVDELGGLDDAVAYIAEKADVSDYYVESYPQYEIGLDEFFTQFTGINSKQSKDDMIRSEIGEEAFDLMQKLKILTEQKGVQARMPFDLNIR